MIFASGGPLGDFLGALSRRLGDILGRLEAILGCLGALLSRLGAFWGRLGAMLGRLGAMLNPQCTKPYVFACFLCGVRAGGDGRAKERRDADESARLFPENSRGNGRQGTVRQKCTRISRAKGHAYISWDFCVPI